METSATTNGDAAKPQTNGNETKSTQQNGKTPTPPEKSDTASKKSPPGGFDSTPLPNAPQGYTIRFCFHHGANLPIADLSTASSDPFVTATLKTNSPKRHRDDPAMFHRTMTIHRTTEPEWNEAWIVANVPASGFTLKCRMYDEDSNDKDDRLGNVTIKVPHVYDEWEGIPAPGKEFGAKKRVIGKRAYLLKGISALFSSKVHITPRLCLSIEVLGKSDPPYAQVYTVGPTRWIKHFSPMIGRIAGTKVNEDENHDQQETSNSSQPTSEKYE